MIERVKKWQIEKEGDKWRLVNIVPKIYLSDEVVWYAEKELDDNGTFIKFPLFGAIYDKKDYYLIDGEKGKRRGGAIWMFLGYLMYVDKVKNAQWLRIYVDDGEKELSIRPDWTGGALIVIRTDKKPVLEFDCEHYMFQYRLVIKR
jgi:hypothetical protein